MFGSRFRTLAVSLVSNFSFRCHFIFDVIPRRRRAARGEARGRTDCLLPVPSKKEYKSGASDCGWSVVARFQPARSVTIELLNLALRAGLEVGKPNTIQIDTDSDRMTEYNNTKTMCRCIRSHKYIWIAYSKQGAALLCCKIV